MKQKERLTLMLVLGLCLTVNLAAQKPADMVGTWVGLATLEGMGGPNEFTLVLEMKEGKIAGHITDQYNTMIEAPIDEIELGEGKFNFSVVGTGPGGQAITLVLKMNVDGDSMEGILEIPDMEMKGTWEASKQ
jgi:hypothetical protein